ncbi:MAG: integrase, partial [Variovorax sp.]
MESTRVCKLANAQKDFPGTTALAALRAWYAGLSARAAVAQYLGQDKASGQSSRTILSEVRRQLAGYARERHRQDLADLLEHPAAERAQRGRAVMDAIETLRHLPAPMPLVTDEVERWLPARAAGAMKAHGIKTL